MKPKYNVSDVVTFNAPLIFVDLQNGRYRCEKSAGTYVICGGMYTLGFVEQMSQVVDNVIIVKEWVTYE